MSSLAPTPEELTDLLARSALGERDAFNRLYTLTSAKLFGVALRIVTQEDQAQDVLQEAYVSIWRNAGSYRPGKAAPMTWMNTIVRNRALDRLRRNKRPETQWEEPGDFDRVANDDPTEEHKLMLSEDAAALQECMGALKENQRRSILLAFFEGLTHEEVAARIGSPLGSIKTWIRRGLISIKECLGS